MSDCDRGFTCVEGKCISDLTPPAPTGPGADASGASDATADRPAVEAGSDSSPPSPSDSGSDASTDASSDASSDASTDANADAGDDADADAGDGDGDDAG